MAKKIVTDNQDALGRWLCERIGAAYYGGGVYIGLQEDDKIIAVVGYENWNGKSLMVHIAGEGKRWLTKEYLWYIFHYPFVEVGADKIIGWVAACNKDALRFDKHLGFEHEATIKDAHPEGDVHLLTMTKEKCRFLRNSEGYPSSNSSEQEKETHGKRLSTTATT